MQDFYLLWITCEGVPTWHDPPEAQSLIYLIFVSCFFIYFYWSNTEF